MQVAKQGDSAHLLWVCNILNSKQILLHLLESGLLCKANQAELASDLTPENAVQVNTALRCLTGNQKLGSRLDEAGRHRARKIKRIQGQAVWLKRQGQLADAEAKLVEMDKLKQEHALLKAGHENQQLLEYMCKLQSMHDNSWEGPLAHGM